jgi:spermidine/putrescine transport system permease protein
MKKQHTWILFLVGPPALWLGLLFVVPLITMVLFTFRSGSFGAEREIFTLAHYQRYLGSTAYHRLLWSSTVLALVISLLSVILAYPVAYFLAFRAGNLRFTFLLTIVIPAWISFLLRIFAWKLILGSGGVLNSLLLSSGLIREAVPLLLYSRSAVIVALVYVYIPFVALPIFVALQRIDRSLLEAAADLGGAAGQTFIRVTFPLSLPGVIAGFLLIFIPTLGEYVTPLLVGGTGSLMYGNLIHTQFSRALNWPLGSLMSVVMLLMTLATLFIFSRLVQMRDWVNS